MTCTWVPLPLEGPQHRCTPDWNPFNPFKPEDDDIQPKPSQCAALAANCQMTPCCKSLFCFIQSIFSTWREHFCQERKRGSPQCQNSGLKECLDGGWEFLYLEFSDLHCRPYFCHRSENFYAYFKEQKHYQNIIIFDISLLKYNIFRNYFQSINSNFTKIYYFCIKKQLLKK